MRTRAVNPAWIEGTAELLLGRLDTPFSELHDDEWIFFGEPSIPAGGMTSVYCSFRDTRPRQLAVADGSGQLVATLRLSAERLVPASFSPEAGVTTQPVAVMQVPEELPGGFYSIAERFAFMVSRIRDPDNITVVAPTSTMYAFNDWGGETIYARPEDRRRYSTQQPLPIRIATSEVRSRGFVEWADAGLGQGWPVSVIADTELGRADVLEHTRTLIVFGRSEYWTREARKAFDRYVDSGGDALMISAETMLKEVQAFDGNRRLEYQRGEEWQRRGREYPVLPSVGANFRDGGFFKRTELPDNSHGNFTILRDSPLFTDTGIAAGATIRLPVAPHDGLPLRGYGDDGTPLVDGERLPFARWELLGYCGGKDSPNGKIGALMCFQRNEHSGRCVHFGSLAWTGPRGLGGNGPDSETIRKLVAGVTRALQERAEIFS